MQSHRRCAAALAEVGDAICALEASGGPDAALASRVAPGRRHVLAPALWRNGLGAHAALVAARPRARPLAMCEGQSCEDGEDGQREEQHLRPHACKDGTGLIWREGACALACYLRLSA